MRYELFDRYAIVVSQSTMSKTLRAMQITGGEGKRRRGKREGRVVDVEDVEGEGEMVEEPSGCSLETP